MCASNIGNAFPPIWQETMSILQDQVPSQPFSVIQDILNEELGGDYKQIFATFDPEPIGSASIGQVHRATLRKNGQAVVVEVRFPNVERLLRGDVRTIKLFCQVAQPVHVPGIEEIERQFQTEFDYRQEAQKLQTVRDNLQRAHLAASETDDKPPCLVPKPYMELCTKRVLVMEELVGDKLVVALRKDFERHHMHRMASAGDAAKSAPLSSSSSSAKEDAGGEYHNVHEFVDSRKKNHGVVSTPQSVGEPVQAATKPAIAAASGMQVKTPTAEEYKLMIALMDGNRRLSNAWNRLYNVSVGWLPGQTPRT